MDHTGRTIVVTGAASGIGAALCQRLAGEGARVIGVDRAEGRHVTLRADLSRADGVGDLCEAIEGPVHGLAHVAGLPGTAPVADILGVNLFAVHHMTSLLFTHLAPGGAVVGVSSVTAERCTWDDQRLETLLETGWAGMLMDEDVARLDGKGAYELSKKALNHWMVRTCPMLQNVGVRINCVSPGPVRTPILADFEASIGADRIAAAATLTGRHGEPEDIADVIAFLLSAEARWVNGVVLKADGGLHALRAATALASRGA